MKTVIAVIVAALLGLAFLYLMKRRETFAGRMDEVILYFAPWCPHCKSFLPEWEKFEQAAKDLPVKVTKVNGDEDPKRVAAKNVEGFPTIRLEKGDKEIEYDGPRTVDGLLNFVKKNTTA